jgi:hypothetical protein
MAYFFHYPEHLSDRHQYVALSGNFLFYKEGIKDRHKMLRFNDRQRETCKHCSTERQREPVTAYDASSLSSTRFT